MRLQRRVGLNALCIWRRRTLLIRAATVKALHVREIMTADLLKPTAHSYL